MVSAFVSDILKFHYDIDFLQEDFILVVEEKLDEEFAIEVSYLIILLEQVQKDVKKLKRVN